MTTWRLLFLQDTRTQQLQVPFNRIQQAFDLIGFMRGISNPGEIIQAEVQGTAAQTMAQHAQLIARLRALCSVHCGGMPACTRAVSRVSS